MPVDTWVHEFLDKQYSQLGIAQAGAPQRRVRKQQKFNPPSTAGFPEIPQEEFLKQVQRRRLGEPSSVTDSIWSMVKAPFTFAFDLLQSGEYAMASALKAINRDEEPFSAFLGGLTAAFTDKEEYKTTMYDMLGEWGWNPDTTSGQVGKFGLGLAMGLALDPLTYLSWGPKTASQFKHSKVFEGIQGRKFLHKFPGFKKGGWLLKEGQQVLDDITPRVLKKLDEVGLDSLALLETRGKAPMKQLMETLTSGQADEFTGTVLKALKKDGMGVDDGAKWLSEGGFAELFDAGGLNLGIPFISSTERKVFTPSPIMGPRSSGLFGMFAGSLIKENKPLTHIFTDKVASSKAWKAVVSDPLKALNDKIGNAFRANRTLNPTMQAFRRVSDKSTELAGPMAADYAATKMATEAVELETKRMGKSEVQVAKGVVKKVSAANDRLVHHLGLEARVRRIKTADIKEWATGLMKKGEIGHAEARDLKMAQDFHFEKLKDTDIQRVGTLLEKARTEHFPELFEFARMNGIKVDVDEYYWPRVMDKRTKLPLEPGTKKKETINTFLSFTQESVGDLDTFAWRKATIGYNKAKGEVIGKPVLGYEEALREYTFAMFHDVRKMEIMEELADTLAKHNIWSNAGRAGGYDPDVAKLLDDLDFTAENPQLMMAIANAADGSKHGMPANLNMQWQRVFKAAEKGNAKEFEAVLNLEPLRGIGPTGKEMLHRKWEAIKKLNKDKPEIFDLMEQAQASVFKKIDEGLVTNETSRALVKALDENFPSLAPKQGVQPEAYTGALKANQHLKGTIIKGTTQDANKALFQAQKKADVAQQFFAGTDRELMTKIADTNGIIKLRKNQILMGSGDAADHVRAIDRAELARDQLFKQKMRMGDLKKDVLTRDELSARFLEADELKTHDRQAKLLVKKLKSMKVKGDSLDKYLPSLLKHASSKRGVDLAHPKVIDELLDLVSNPKRNKDLARFLEEPAEEYIRVDGLFNRTVKVTGMGRVHAQEVSLPKTIRKALRLDDTLSIAERDDLIGTLHRSLNLVTNPLKKALTSEVVPFVPRVSFFVRNKFDLYVRPILDMDFMTATTRKFKKEVAEMMFNKDGFVKIRGVNVRYKELLDRYNELGAGMVAFERIASGEIPRAVQAKLQDIAAGRGRVGKLWKEVMDAVPGKKQLGKLKKWSPEAIGLRQENGARLQKIMLFMEAGDDMDTAVHKALKTYFDFTNLTNFEKAMAPLVMFYSFNRQAVPYALRVMQKHPEVFTAMERMKTMAFGTDKDKAMVPQWMWDFPFVALKEGKEDYTIASFRNIFTTDTLGDVLPRDIQGLLGKINPLITIIPELQLGKDLYFNKDIKDVKFLHEPVSELGGKTWARWLNLRPRKLQGYQGKEFWAVDGYNYHLLSKTYNSRLYKDLERMAKIYEAKDKKTIFKHLITLATGVKLHDLSYEVQRNIMASEAKRGENEYKSALRRGDAVKAREVLEELRINKETGNFAL